MFLEHEVSGRGLAGVSRKGKPPKFEKKRQSFGVTRAQNILK